MSRDFARHVRPNGRKTDTLVFQGLLGNLAVGPPEASLSVTFKKEGFGRHIGAMVSEIRLCLHFAVPPGPEAP